MRWKIHVQFSFACCAVGAVFRSLNVQDRESSYFSASATVAHTVTHARLPRSRLHTTIQEEIHGRRSISSVLLYWHACFLTLASSVVTARFASRSLLFPTSNLFTFSQAYLEKETGVHRADDDRQGRGEKAFHVSNAGCDVDQIYLIQSAPQTHARETATGRLSAASSPRPPELR